MASSPPICLPSVSPRSEAGSLELRNGFGRAGDFPFLAQAMPPHSVEAARAMAREYRDAGVDGLILTYEAPCPRHSCLRTDVVKALIESAAG